MHLEPMTDGGDDMQPAVHKPQAAMVAGGAIVGSNADGHQKIGQLGNAAHAQPPPQQQQVVQLQPPAAEKPVAAAAAIVPPPAAAAVAAAPAAATIAAVVQSGEIVDKSKESQTRSLAGAAGGGGGVDNDAASLLAAALGPTKPTPKHKPVAVVAAKPTRPGGASPAHVQGGATAERTVSVRVCFLFLFFVLML